MRGAGVFSRVRPTLSPSMPPDLTADFIALQTALAGEYSLDCELGRGGMGVVYLAREVQLSRPVAIKVLPPELTAQPICAMHFSARRRRPPASRTRTS